MTHIWRCAAAALALCLLAMPGAEAREKPDLTDSPNITDGDWIQPADILFVGDSESLGFFGAQLYRSLSTEPDPKSGKPLKVWSLWTCGSDVDDWLTGATSFCGIRTCNGAGACARDYGPLDRPGRIRYSALRAYVGRVRPRVTIVSLGSNMLSWSARDFHEGYGSYLASVKRLAGVMTAGNSQCIWIGPPQVSLKTKPVAEYERFVADVGKAATAAGCAYIDSNPLSDRKYVLRSDSEGIHYDGAGERDWETRVWGKLRPVLRAQLSR